MCMSLPGWVLIDIAQHRTFYASSSGAGQGGAHQQHLTFKKYRFVTPSKRGSEFELDGSSWEDRCRNTESCMVK